MSRLKEIQELKENYPDVYKGIEAMLPMVEPRQSLFQSIREHVAYILLYVVVAIAAFEAGVIHQSMTVRDFEKKIYKLEDRQVEASGKMEAVWGVLRSKGLVAK